jgi:PPM family protein phosphatase
MDTSMSQNAKNLEHGVANGKESQSSDLFPHNVPSALVQVDLAGQSHQGHVRSKNEDHYLAVRASRSLETLLTNLTEFSRPKSFSEAAYGMLVADGMGGLAAGEVASRFALLKLLELALETPDWVMKMDQPDNAAVVMRRMTHRFRQIDDELRAQGESTPDLLGMGTTLTVAITLGANLFVGHIGDSRAYLLRGEKLHQLTKDHTLAQALIDAGIANADDAATRAMRNLLTAALGTTSERSDPQVRRLHLSDGDQLLLCSDGLSEMVADDLITSVLRSTRSSAVACQDLIELALAGGGLDNITVVLARYRFLPASLE